MKTVALHNYISDGTLIFTWARVDNLSVVTSVRELLGFGSCDS